MGQGVIFFHKVRVSGAAGAAAGAAAAGAARRGQRLIRFHREAHVAQVQLDAFHSLQQFFIYTKGEATFLKHVIIVVGLIQSQRQARAASATGGEIDTNGTFFFVRKVRFQLFAGAFSQFNHKGLLNICAQ